MEHVEEMVQQVSDSLGEIAQSDVVVGTPTELGGVTLVPISRVTVGFGGGGGQGEGDQPPGRKRPQGSGSGKGGGTGGGAVVRPVAVVAFADQGVQVLPIAERQGKLEKLLDQIPDLIDRFHNDRKA